jgi:mono/diheme cytochrome c family protein
VTRATVINTAEAIANRIVDSSSGGTAFTPTFAAVHWAASARAATAYATPTSDRDTPRYWHHVIVRVALMCAAVSLLASACGQPVARTDPVARGRSLYGVVGCTTCHEPNSYGGSTGPRLDHIGSIAATRRAGMTAEEYIRESILDPLAYEVPGYEGFLSRRFDEALSVRDLDDLVAYLVSLK